MTGEQIDDFNYVYYSGTNKLQRVTGSGTQYTQWVKALQRRVIPVILSGL